VEIILVDTRKLGAVIARNTPAGTNATATGATTLDGRFYNPDTTGWEAPFDAAKHVFKPKPMTDPTFANVQIVDIGNVLLEHDDAVAFIVVLPPGGGPPIVIDCWALPPMQPAPVIGGLGRG
jgi:hypothetical protein